MRTLVRNFVEEDREVNIFIELAKLINAVQDDGRYFQQLNATRTMADGSEISIEMVVRKK